MDKKKKDNKAIHIIPESLGIKIIAVLLLVAELGFLYLVIQLNVLPVKYMALVVAVLIIAAFALVLLLASRRSRSKRITGIVLTVFMIAILAVGAYYVINTYDTLSKITGASGEYETFDVVVPEDSTCQTIKDLRNETIYVVSNGSKVYKEAKGELSGIETVQYKEVADCVTAAEDLSDAANQDDAKAMLVSDANYKMVCEEINGYKNNSRVLYKLRVEIQKTAKGKQIDVTKDSFNVYISGIDFWGDINEVSRSDVNMIVTVNPKTRQVLLTSIPRDSYVKLHTVQQMDKLTHSGVYGIDETTSTVEDWMGIDIDYYVRANFNMCMELVNAMDGIDVYSDYSFKSSISKYTYKKGWNYLTGKQALYFARERKSFKDSDQQRIKDQQKVVKAMIKKLTGSRVMLTNYTKLLDSVEGYMQTDMSQKEIASLVRMQLNDMSTKWTINSISIKGYETMKGTYSMGFGRPLIVNITDENSVKRATRLINRVEYPENGKVVKIKDDKSKKNNLKEQVSN